MQQGDSLQFAPPVFVEAAQPGRGSPLLAAIGNALDADLGCDVYDNGFVRPRAGSGPDPFRGHEEVRKNAERHAEPSRQHAEAPTASRSAGATGWAAWSTAAPARAAAPGSRTPVLSAVAQGPTIEEVLRAYPSFRARSTSAGLWLTGEVQPVQDLPARAVLRVLVPQIDQGSVRAWAWWSDGIWIGPRHTNYPDGSICSYERSDGTWSWDKGLLLLIDLHMVWIARHLHLAEYARWPGRQVLHTPFERLTEHQPGEYCGCGSDELYDACCRPADVGLGLVRALTLRGARNAVYRRRPILPQG